MLVRIQPVGVESRALVMQERFRIYRRHLPHWRLDDAVYFATWCLARGQPSLTVLEREQIAGVLRSFAEKRYDLLAYVIMNDHVHVLVRPYLNFPLERLMHTWKSYSGHLLRSGRSGKVWQREYFDRIVRDEKEMGEKLEYIRNNPFLRWPGIDSYPWVWCCDDDSG